MILDAGALIAVDRHDRAMIARLVAAYDEGDELRTHPLVVAQVWRARARQAQLSRLLHCVEIVPIADEMGRRAGELLGKAGTSDAIDATVVLLARDGEPIVTSDPEDILRLTKAAKRRAVVVAT